MCVGVISLIFINVKLIGKVAMMKRNQLFEINVLLSLFYVVVDVLRYVLFYLCLN